MSLKPPVGSKNYLKSQHQINLFLYVNPDQRYTAILKIKRANILQLFKPEVTFFYSFFFFSDHTGEVITGFMPVVLCKTFIQRSIVFKQILKWLYSGDFKVTELCPFSFNYKLGSYLLLRYLKA